MQDIIINLGCISNAFPCIGFQGENEHRRIVFDAGEVYADYPDAVVTMVIKPPVGEVYPKIVTRDGNNVIWSVTAADVAYPDNGAYQLTFTNGTEIIKTYVGIYSVAASIIGNGQPPKPVEDWLKEAQAMLNAFAEMTAEANTLLPGSDATVELTEEDGHKVFLFGIPRGDTGNGIASCVLNADYTLTITFTDGNEYTTPSIRGAKGEPGKDGEDGFSPVVVVSEITGGHRVVITDAQGDNTFDVLNGEDGFAPVVVVTTITGGHRVTVTDASGSTSFDVMDGIDGTNGTSAYVWIRYSAAEPTQDSDMKTTPDAWMGIYSGSASSAPTHYTDYAWYNIKGATGEVSQAELDAVETELKSAIDEKAPLIRDTVTNVPIASVPDGADGLPLTALKIAIDPIQDLHGQDAPYPPGGGDNILNPGTNEEIYGVKKTVNADGSITFKGTATSTADFYFNGTTSSGTALNLPTGTYRLYGSEDGGANTYLFFLIYVNNGSTYYANGKDHTAITMESGTTGRLFLRVQEGQSVDITVKLWFGLGTMTAWTPYSNICPISGWTGCNVPVTGVNVWDEQWEVGSINSSGNNIVSSTTIRTKNYIPVIAGSTYYYKSTETAGFRFYDSNKTFLSSATVTKNATFTVPNGAFYLRFVVLSGYGTTYNNDISINYPATDTAYHAYTGQTYPISWQTEAGTVYGGTLDVTTGVLTRDKVFANLNDKTLWYGDSGFIAYRYDFSDRKLFTDSFTGLISSFALADETKPVHIRWRGALQARIRVEGVPIETLQSMSDAGTATICYELANPITYQLTPTEISAIKGQMNVWADCGNVLEMTYPCDTKAYIDKKLTELTALVLES